MNMLSMIILITGLLAMSSSFVWAQSSPSADNRGYLVHETNEGERSSPGFGRNSTWVNRRGERNVNTGANWDRQTGTGIYSTRITTPSGQTIDRQREVIQNPDGSVSVHSEYTTPNGKKVTIDKTIDEEADPREERLRGSAGNRAAQIPWR